MKGIEDLEPEIVSLIIPCYNGGKYIESCLDCVIKQDYRNKIELIFINDGSSDQTEQLFMDKKPLLERELYRVIYVSQENAGVGSATKTALQFVSGEFLTSLDVDDYLFPESISRKADYLYSHPDISCVYSNGFYSYNNREKEDSLFYQDTFEIGESELFDALLDGKAVNWAGSYMIRFSTWLDRCPDREIFPSRYGQNLQLLLPAAYKEKTHFMKEPLMKYIIYPGSFTHMEKSDHGKQDFELIYRFEEIYVNIIETICTEEDKEKYLLKIKKSSIRTRMGIASRYKNAELMKMVKNEFSSIGGMTLNDGIAIYSVCNRKLSIVLRIIRKVISICPREAEQNTH